MFPSASEDIGLNINNGTQGVAMSHYALLNFTKENFGYTDPTEIVKGLQNYAMNFETLLTNQSDYNFQEPTTVSEQVFWHWLSSNNGSSKTKNIELEEIGNSGLFREKHYATNDPNRLVQCFGSIDSGNSLSTDFGMFNETYVTVPTSYGNGAVFFRRVNDNVNYKSNETYYASNYIEGRSATDVGYIGSVESICDDNSSKFYKDDCPLEIVKDIPSIQAALREMSGDTTIQISSYDDVNIDTDNIIGRIEIDGQKPYDMSGQCEYKFNAILLYYSIYDLNDVYKQAVATNLFGVVFLDGGNGNAEQIITPLIKKKSFSGQTSVNAYFGNSFSFRVNLKTLSVYDNTDARIDDNTTTTSSYSIDFNDVISNLNRAIDVMNTNVQTTMAIQDKYQTMMAYYVEIRESIDALKNDLEISYNEQLSKALSDIDSKFEQKMIELRDELGLNDGEAVGSDGLEIPTDTFGNSVRSNRLTRRGVDKSTYVLGLSNTQPKDERSGRIIDSKIDIMSATDVNQIAENNINLSARNIVFNLKEGDDIAKVSVYDIISKINDLNSRIDEVIEIGGASSVDGIHTEDVQYFSSDEELEEMLSKQNDEVSEDKTEHEKENVSNSLSTEQIIALGIYPINGIMSPRKKPNVVGYYLKENTNGNITNVAYYNGETFNVVDKCQYGKMYSVNGLIYVFNGETCKLLGE